jgi:hypothetical protein
MKFDSFQNYFVVFGGRDQELAPSTGINFLEVKPVQELSGVWEVAFDPKWGGPEHITFETLQDWAKRPEVGIK